MVVHRKQKTNSYECVKRSRASGLCTQPGISTRVLDGAVWSRVESFLTRPEIVARELEQLQSEDPTQFDLETIERGISDAARKISNLTRALAMFEDPEAAAPVVAEIQALRSQQRSFDAERVAVLARRVGWEEGQRRLADLQQWCKRVSTRLITLTYEQKRLALEALGVGIKVWKADHDPRYIITAHLDLDALPVADLNRELDPDPATAPCYMLRPRRPVRSGNW